jgi:hypothetical protein
MHPHPRMDTHTHALTHTALCNIYCFSMVTMISWTRLDVTSYVHDLSCYTRYRRIWVTLRLTKKIFLYNCHAHWAGYVSVNTINNLTIFLRLNALKFGNNIPHLYLPPRQCIYVSCTNLRANKGYFPIQHLLTSLNNREGMCLLGGTSWNFKCN